MLKVAPRTKPHRVIPASVAKSMARLDGADTAAISGTPASGVAQDALERVMDLARSLLQANVVDGTPAAIQTYRSLRRADRRSDPEDSLWVYSRGGKPCRKCGAAIASKKMGLDARTTYWCPTCQVGPC